jgi:DNA repair protein RecO (recombination protein O)
MNLLQALGYGLDLSRCAVHGKSDNLAYISPRSGRAVSREAGMPYHERLFPLPAFLIGGTDWDIKDIVQGLEMTGHFLSRQIFVNPQSRILIPSDGDLPQARQRLSHYFKNQLEAHESQVA